MWTPGWGGQTATPPPTTPSSTATVSPSSGICPATPTPSPQAGGTAEWQNATAGTHCANFNLDDVDITLFSPVAPGLEISLPLPGTIQSASSDGLSIDFMLEAIPFGARSPENIPATASGGAAAYRAQLHDLRAAGGGTFQQAQSIQMFGQSIPGEGAHRLLTLSSTGVDALEFDWVAAAGSRIWVLRITYPANQSDSQQPIPDPSTFGRLVVTSSDVNNPTTITGIPSASP
jgi:hypothetical protein